MRRSAYRRYTWSVMLLMVGYVAALFGVNAYFDNGPPSGAIAYAAAVLPALPIVGVFFVLGRLLVELDDEYVRMLMVRQTLVATAFMLSVATIWGFVESFGLLPHVEAYWAAILWFGGLGVGGCANLVIESRGPST
jgi:hypothetical protein